MKKNQGVVALTSNAAVSPEIGADTLIGVENITGGACDDVVLGSAGANVLRGGAENDYLAGAAGDDVLEGGAGRAMTCSCSRKVPTITSRSTLT